MKFCDELKNLRVRLFMSQEMFAKELNVTHNTVCRWEAGFCLPNRSLMSPLRSFCEKYGQPFEPLANAWINERSRIGK